MLGPSLLSLEAIPTLLRQGRQSGLPAETQNYSAYLDGASDYISGFNIATTWLKVWTTNQDFSIHFSIKLDTVASQTISFTGSSTNFFWIQTDVNGRLTVSATISNAIVGFYAFDTSFAADTWYDIMLTSSAAGAFNRTLNLYVNGVATPAHTISAVFARTTDIAAIGGRFTIGTLLLAIDYDFRIDRLYSWTSELTQAEVTEIYNNYPDLTADSGNYVSSANLETYYKIEEGSGTTISDSSGNSNGNLTAFNATGNFWSTDTRI